MGRASTDGGASQSERMHGRLYYCEPIQCVGCSPWLRWASGRRSVCGELALLWRIAWPPAQSAEAGLHFSVLQLS